MERAFVEAVLSRHWWRMPGAAPYDDDDSEAPPDMRTPTENFTRAMQGASFVPPLNPLTPAGFIVDTVDDPAELDMIMQLAPRETALPGEDSFRAFRFASALRVQNEQLLEMFRSVARGGGFRVGFHGTIDNNNYQSILQFGFAPHRSHTNVYEVGTHLAAHPGLCLSHYTTPMGNYAAVIMGACALGELKAYEPGHLQAHQGAFRRGADEFEEFIVQDYRRIYPAYVLLYEQIPGLPPYRGDMQSLLEHTQGVLAEAGLTPYVNEGHDLLLQTPSGEAVSWRRGAGSGWYASRYERRYEHQVIVTVELVCAFALGGRLRNDEAIKANVYIYQNAATKGENMFTCSINTMTDLNQFVHSILRPALMKAEGMI